MVASVLPSREREIAQPQDAILTQLENPFRAFPAGSALMVLENPLTDYFNPISSLIPGFSSSRGILIIRFSDGHCFEI